MTGGGARHVVDLIATMPIHGHVTPLLAVARHLVEALPTTPRLAGALASFGRPVSRSLFVPIEIDSVAALVVCLVSGTLPTG